MALLSNARARQERAQSTSGPRAGISIAGYTLLRELGTGQSDSAAGRCVWLARDDKRNREVALKLARIDSGIREQALEREFEWLMLLVHEQLPEVYGIGIDPSLTWAWVAMEFVDGVTLDRALSDHGAEAAPELLWQACRALKFLHERHQVVHGDLKPENILVRGTPQHLRLKLIDLGLSSRIGVGDEGVVRGTPYYAAPSILRGEPPTTASDVFALGTSFVEGLTGERQGGAHLDGLVSPALVRVLQRMIQPDEDTRYSSASEVLKELDAEHRESAHISECGEPRSHFVGRGEELTWFSGWIEELREGSSATSLALVSGPAGTGKSRLLEELSRRAELVGARVRAGRSPKSGAGAYQRLIDVLDFLAVEEERPSLVSELVQLRNRLEKSASAQSPGRTDESHDEGLWVEFLDLLDRNSAGTPLLIVFDDLDPIEPLLFEFLALVARDSSSGSVGFVAALSSTGTELSSSARGGGAASHEVERAPGTRQLELSRLSHPESVHLIESILGSRLPDRELCNQIAAATAGHPQFAASISMALLRESTEGGADLSSLLRRELPETLADALERQLDSLGSELRGVVDRLSISKFGLPQVVLRSLLDDQCGADDSLNELIRAGILRRSESPRDNDKTGDASVEFTSQALRRLACDSLSDAERESLHANAYRAWTTLDPGGMRALAHTEHAIGCRDAALAYSSATAALDHLLAKHAIGAVSALAERVLALGKDVGSEHQRAQVHERLGDAYLLKGDPTQACRNYDSALNLGSDPVGTSRSLRKRAQARDELGQSEAARIDLLAAYEQVAMLDPVECSAICALLGMVQYRCGHAVEAEKWLWRGIESLPDAERDPAAAGIWNNLGILDMYRNRPRDGRRHFERALSIHERFGNLHGRGKLLTNLGSISMISGELGRAREFFGQALRIKRRLGDRRAVALTLSNLAQLEDWIGSYGPAIQNYEEALSIRNEAGDVAGAVTTQAHLAEVWHVKGELTEALSQSAQALQRSTGRSDVARVNALLSSSRIELTLGRLDVATELANEGVAIARECEAVADEALLLATLGELEQESGTAASSRANSLSRAAELASRIGNPQVLAAVLVSQAECALVRDEMESAERVGEKALALSEELELRFLVARIEVVLGSVASARGAIDDASRRLHRAEEFALLFAAPELTWKVCYALAAFHREQGRERRALRWVEKCLTAIGGVVAGLRDEELEKSYLGAPKRAEALASMESWLREDGE